MSEVLGTDDDITRFEYTKEDQSGTGPVVIRILLKEPEALTQLLANLAKFDPEYINLRDNASLYTLLV